MTIFVPLNIKGQMEYNNKRNSRYTRNEPKSPTVSELGKLQPQDIEIEEAVLGAMMLEKDAYTIVVALLRSDSFSEPSNKKQYGKSA